MNLQNKTILITGGGSGIGYEIAKLLSEKGNTVIITGRTLDKLQSAAATLQNVHPIVCDVTDPNAVGHFVEKIKEEYPELSMVINNAGAAFVYNLTTENVDAFDKAQIEIITNYLSIIRFNELFLPLLKQQQEAAIVNVSSVVAFVPGGLATYSASKAALHSYTQSLRIALENSSKVKVFELMPPLVDTEFSAPIGGSAGIAPSIVAAQFVEGIENDHYEIRVGQTEDIYRLYLSSPAEALKVMNGNRISAHFNN